MGLLQTADFVGSYAVAQDQITIIDLQKVIDEFERVYLAKMFGATLSVDLFNYIDGGSSPINPSFDFIYNPFTLDLDCELLISLGVKKALIGFIYYEYVFKSKIKASQISGVERVKTENSTTSIGIEPQVYNAYNNAVKTTKAIQYYILRNKVDYPYFNGRKFILNYAL